MTEAGFAMINKRLIREVPESKKYVAAAVLWQWVSLAANIVLMAAMSYFLAELHRVGEAKGLIGLLTALVASLAARYAAIKAAGWHSFRATALVKKTLRTRLYEKLLRIGPSYRETAKTSELLQVAVEGIEQLETYFGAYLPQFFYAMLAPLTLFGVLCFVSVPAAVVLLLCVPLIPISIAAVMTFAKKLLAKYWGQYASLGDTFLENLQGLTTLKIYQADEERHRLMNEEAEKFRKITMRVLMMQLNSITVMDIFAFGGAAAGILIAVSQYGRHEVSLFGCLLIILLSAEFFLPMRQLGSFFHVAMNGMAAADRLFKIMDSPEPEEASLPFPESCDFIWRDVRFSYVPEREILKGVSPVFPQGAFTALVGESGCGKSTIASILTGRNRGYTGEIKLGGRNLAEIRSAELLKQITFIGHKSHLFKGTVRDNLLMGDPDASDEKLWAVLEKVKIADFLRAEEGLDTAVLEGAVNLSGGQRQRIALARALLHDSSVYIFDEAASNIDIESEEAIMEQVHELAKSRTVVLISHRLANATRADNIYVMDDGQIVEEGTHDELLKKQGHYAKLWETQASLENFREVKA